MSNSDIKSSTGSKAGTLTINVSVPILSIVDYVTLDTTVNIDPKLLFALFDVMISSGVAPWLDNSHDVERVLAVLGPEEARKMKRKFRKLWRAALKREQKGGMILSFSNRYGGVGQHPSRAQKRQRKELVMRVFRVIARSQAYDK